MWGGPLGPPGPPGGTIIPDGGPPKGKGDPEVGINGGPDEPGRLGDCPRGPQFEGEFGTGQGPHGPSPLKGGELKLLGGPQLLGGPPGGGGGWGPPPDM